MDRLTQKQASRTLRKARVRAKVFGTAERPRLCARISNRHVSAQIIDDDTHKTLVYITSAAQKAATGTLTTKAAWVGTEIAKKAKLKKINRVVLDRGSRLYHGRIKALADAARESGLEF